MALLISIHSQAIDNEYVFEQITSNTGFTFKAISNISEDKYGFIWFGSNNGLYYYNSSEIIKYNFDLTKPDAPQSNKINYIYKDKVQKLWICTDNGICYFNEELNSFTQLKFRNTTHLKAFDVRLLYQINDEIFAAIINNDLYKINIKEMIVSKIELIKNTGVSYFTADNNGNLYVAYNNATIYKTDESLNKKTIFYKHNIGQIATLEFFNDQLWIGSTNLGIEVINKKAEKVKVLKEEFKGHQHIISNRIKSILKDSNNDIWIGTLEGITILNSTGGYQDIKARIQNKLPHEGIFHLYQGSNNCVWVSTWSGGLAFYSKLNYKFPQFQSSTSIKSDWNSLISSFSEDKSGNILIGSENHGLFIFSPTTNTYIPIKNSPIQRIKSIRTDKQQRLWIGTLFEGLWLYENGKLKSIGKIEDIMTTVLPVENGVWIGTRGGGAIFYNESTKTFENFKSNSKNPKSICSDQIWYIFEDSYQNIWFCTNNGLSVKYKNDKHFTNFQKETHGLSSNQIYTIAEDQKGDIWIGTSNFGIDIYNPKTKSFKRFSENETIKDAEIYSFLKDKKNNMWFSSNQGIFAYYSDLQKLKRFTKEDGLLAQQYHPNSSFVSKNGILYFGGGIGFNIIDPEIVQPNTSQPEIFLSKFIINNQSIENQKVRFVNSAYLSAINKIVLNYNQNSIGAAFVVNSYIKNSKSYFRYRLLNYIDDWNTVKYNSDITYTKIPPGKYTLQVEFINNDGINVGSLKEFEIEIKPPFWLTWYAYLLYFAIIGTIVFIALRELRYREKSRADQMLSTEKVKFFMNASHEFRTPLTLIISPINNLIKKHKNESETLENLKTIQRNADRLLRLTNQILDFRLIELNNVQLKKNDVDLIALCNSTIECFDYQMRTKEIDFIYNSNFKSFNLFVDAEKIEKVIFNILSNALKFIDDKGQIIFSIEQKTLQPDSYSKVFYSGNNYIGDVLEIKIKDNGRGIKKSILNNIFDRFIVDSENIGVGSGIGLHICKEYISLHNGNIMVESEPGKETIFSINIPIESEAKFEKESLLKQSNFDSTSYKINEADNELTSNTKHVILLAEDNNELRDYYKKTLSSRYKVITAKNGNQALELANELIPTLIISDILMPGLDGLSLTEKIRTAPELKHIPIILLTSISENEVKIKSLHKGANEFLTKPVDEELLIAKIDNILSNTQTLINKFKGDTNKSHEIKNSTQTFIEKVEQIIELNIQDSSFEITKLASLVGVSRSSLQRKINTAVNMSPSEFIRDIRLKNAVNLLNNDKYNIDEIAIIVGFNSTSYFIRSFKKKYNMSPTAFKQRMAK